MNNVTLLLSALERDPGDDGAWLAWADALEEQGDSARAEMTRLSLWLRRQPDDTRQPEWETRLHELANHNVRVCLPRWTVSLAEGVDLTLVLIPPGSFWMGSADNEPDRSEDERRHFVTLTKGFWMGIHPVTQTQWLAVMDTNPSEFRGDSNPVDHVSWSDCQRFCRRLNKRTRKRFRLPTEAEWEYSCRAGTTTPYHFGQTISVTIANYDANGIYGPGERGIYRQQSTPVCSFPDNPWGLFDVHGTIYEWCQDWYGRYPIEPVIDPQGPEDGENHPLRGGSWYAFPNGCRSAYRNYGHPGRRENIAGFRVAMELVESSA